MTSKRILTFAGVLFLAALLIGASYLPVVQATTGKWRNINPTEYTTIPDTQLNSVYMLNGGTGGIGSGDGWAVGNNGTVFHWDGFAWNNYTMGTTCNLNSVNFGSPLSVPMNEISSSAGFMVGGNTSATVCSGQKAWFWNGNSWFEASTGLISPGNLSSVFLYQVSGSSVSAFAVGANATAGASYQFNGVPGGGGGWTAWPVQGSTGCSLTSVYMVSATEGWAVGHCGKVYHWMGGAWTNPFTFGGVDFYSIFMDSSTDGWAVGSGGQVFQYASGSWNGPVYSLPTHETLRSVSFVSSSEAWVVGDAATIVHYSGGTWTPVSSTLIPTLRGLRGVHATGGSNVWTVGETGSILMWDGSVWGSITSPVQTNFNSVFMTGSNDGAAVGNVTFAGPTIMRWDGVKWTRPQGTSSPTDLWGVWEANSGEWWAVGGGPGFYPYILHMTSVSSTAFSGTSFTTAPCGATCVLRSVYGTSSGNVWAVGDGGVFAQWTGGSNWGLVPPLVAVPVGTMWRAVTFVGGDSNNGWVVGYSPTGPLIYHYTSTGWTNAPGVPTGFPTNVRLNDVQFLDSSHGWAAGDNGWILFYDGTQWNPVFTVGTYNLTAIHVTSTSDGWAIGQDTSNGLPVFVHWDGNAWSTVGTIPPLPSQTVGRLQSMFLLSSTNGFAVGTTAGAGGIASLGMMFHLDPPSGGPPPPTTTMSTSTSVVVTTSTSVVTSTSSATSSSQVSTSTTQSSTSSSSSSGTSSTSSGTVTVTVTSSSGPTTPLVAPPIPGFPWESIVAGIIVGLSLLVIIRRRRMPATA